MKLTIAIDDISIPLPPMITPDIRQRILEHVIELAARKGVEDVELVVATALHRRMTADEIQRMVGERVFRSFWPNDLSNFDAEDRDELTEIGETDQGEVVEISKRAAESDLIVYVNINLVAMDGGHKSVAVGLASYESLKHHHNVDTMLHSQLLHGPAPGHSAINDSATRMGRLLAASGVKIFQIETTLNTETFPSQLGFLNKREWEWSAKDQALMMAAKKANDMAPPRVRREFFRRIEAPYKVTGINAGEVEAVHERTLENLHRQQLVEVQGQSDIVVFGLPVPRPVQRELDPEPDPRALPGARLPVQHVPEQAARARGRRRDPVPPGARGSSTRSTTRATSTSSRRSWPRPPIPRRSRRSTRSATRPTRGTCTCTGRPTRTTACTRSTCGTGARTAATTAGDVIFVGGEPKSRRAPGLPPRRLAARRAGDGEGHGRLQPVDHVLPRAADHDRGRALRGRHERAARRAEGDGPGVPLGPAPAGARDRPSRSPRRRTTTGSRPTGRGPRRASLRGRRS